MMLTRHALILLFFCAAIGCQPRQALDFSEKIVAIEMSMKPAIDSSNTIIYRLMEEDETDSLALITGQMERLAESKLEEIRWLTPPDVKEAAYFKKAALLYFEHIKNLYTSYKEYAVAGNERAREEAREKMIRMEEQTNEMVKEMQAAQQKFARANGFTIK